VISNCGYRRLLRRVRVSDRETRRIHCVRGLGRSPGAEHRRARTQARKSRLADRAAGSSTRSACRPRTWSAPSVRDSRGARDARAHATGAPAAQAVGDRPGRDDYAVGYARERRQFGKPISEFRRSSSSSRHGVATAAARELLTAPARWPIAASRGRQVRVDGEGFRIPPPRCG